MSDIVHGSAVALDGRGVVLLGASASGKSSLAARLIEAHGGALIGDDRLHLARDGDSLWVRPHAQLAGMLELRGLGLAQMTHLAQAPVHLVVDLVARQDVPRVADEAYFIHDGQRVPKLTLHAHDSATPMIIVHAMVTLAVQGFREDAIY